MSKDDQQPRETHVLEARCADCGWTQTLTQTENEFREHDDQRTYHRNGWRAKHGLPTYCPTCAPEHGERK